MLSGMTDRNDDAEVSDPELEGSLARLTTLLERMSDGSPAVGAAAVTSLLGKLPPVMSADDVAGLLQVDVKVVYAAVSEHGLPMRPVGRRKCLRGLTVAILLWIARSWDAADGDAVRSRRQGRVVPTGRGRHGRS